MKSSPYIVLCCLTLSNVPAWAQKTHTETVCTGDVSRQVRTYDSDNNMISVRYEVKKGDGWKHESQRTCITYDAKKHETSCIHQYPNEHDDTAWNNHDRVFTTYDTAGNVIETHDQIWGEVKPNTYGWVDHTRIIHAYNSHTLDTCEVHTQHTQRYTSAYWQNTMRILRSDTCELYQIWRDTHWEDNSRTITIYNPATKEKTVKQQHMTTKFGWADDLKFAPPGQR